MRCGCWWDNHEVNQSDSAGLYELVGTQMQATWELHFHLTASDMCHLWICCVVWRSRYSPESLRPLSACQGIFSILIISFLIWCHFSVLIMRKTHHIWGVKKCLLGGQILPWSILFRGSMNPVGGNNYFRRPKLDVILFYMFYKSLKVLQNKRDGKIS